MDGRKARRGGFTLSIHRYILFRDPSSARLVRPFCADVLHFRRSKQPRKWMKTHFDFFLSPSSFHSLLLRPSLYTDTKQTSHYFTLYRDTSLFVSSQIPLLRSPRYTNKRKNFLFLGHSQEGYFERWMIGYKFEGKWTPETECQEMDAWALVQTTSGIL